MIQRIQTVYLLLAAVALSAVPFIDALWYSAAVELSWFEPAIVGLVAVTVALSVTSIFFYKQRERQRTLVLVTQVFVVLLVLALYGGFYLVDGLNIRVAGGVDWSLLVLFLLPVAAYVLLFLARRGIEHDIELVRSMDRLR